MLISRTPGCMPKALGSLYTSSSANQVFYFLCLDVKCLKTNSFFLGTTACFAGHGAMHFFPLPFQWKCLTCIQVSELGLIQVEFPIGFVLLFNEAIPHIATPSLGIWVPCCLFSFLSLELLSTATSHRAARTRLLLEAKGDREKWQTSKWQHRFLWRGLRSPHIWVSKIQITFFLFENSHMQIIPNLSREDGKDKT